MSATRRETTVNGIDVTLWSHIDNEHAARQAAAALPRGKGGVEIDEAVEDGAADLWVRLDDGAKMEVVGKSGHLLPGWEIESVSLHAEDCMCVTVRPRRGR